MVTSGWRVSGETTIQDGQPLSIVDNNLGSIFGFSGGTPIASQAEFLPALSNANVPTHGSIDNPGCHSSWLGQHGCLLPERYSECLPECYRHLERYWLW